MLRAQIAPVDNIASAAEQGTPRAESLWQDLRRLLRDEAPWWSVSFIFHVALLSLVALFGGMVPAATPADLVAFESAAPEPPENRDTTVDPSVTPTPAPLDDALVVDTPDLVELKDPATALGTPNGNEVPQTTALTANKESIGGDGMNAWQPLGVGPRPTGEMITGTWGKGGDAGPRGKPFDGRTHGPRIKACENCVIPALAWFARHQLPDGNWSLHGYTARCTDKTCSGAGGAQADSAATALALLPFLAYGITQRSPGKYQHTVAAGLNWLVRQQKPDGDLRCGATMYAHGLATIALCEAYGMTGDRSIGYAAQRAVDFLVAAQNRETGGWRYQPGESGDLSVAGWQIMALKSAEMAGLRVEPGAFQRARDFLAATSKGQGGSASASDGRGQFAYQPGAAPSKTMTAVGLLCNQYLGMRRHDPTMTAGTARLMAALPAAGQQDLYFWYYATQVMHNQPGPEWDTWNRRVRELLIETQERRGCAAGSWDPARPSPDPWGAQGGRLMTTALAALTLEVYYRYIPLYKYSPDEGRAGESGEHGAGSSEQGARSTERGAGSTERGARSTERGARSGAGEGGERQGMRDEEG